MSKTLNIQPRLQSTNLNNVCQSKPTASYSTFYVLCPKVCVKHLSSQYGAIWWLDLLAVLSLGFLEHTVEKRRSLTTM